MQTHTKFCFSFVSSVCHRWFYTVKQGLHQTVRQKEGHRCELKLIPCKNVCAGVVFVLAVNDWWIKTKDMDPTISAMQLDSIFSQQSSIILLILLTPIIIVIIRILSVLPFFVNSASATCSKPSYIASNSLHKMTLAKLSPLHGEP